MKMNLVVTSDSEYDCLVSERECKAVQKRQTGKGG
jgi:hypothetical protein